MSLETEFCFSWLSILVGTTAVHCHVNALVLVIQLVIIVSHATKIALATQTETENSTVPNHDEPG